MGRDGTWNLWVEFSRLPKRKCFDVGDYCARAHSTVLEMAAELGLPFTGLVVIAWIIVLAVLVRGVWIWRRDVVVPIAALSVAALALGHSLIDFSLQIPGYAIVVFALLGAGLSQSFSSRGKDTAFRAGRIVASRISIETGPIAP